jgi:hypothetical protein
MRGSVSDHGPLAAGARRIPLHSLEMAKDPGRPFIQAIGPATSRRSP